MLFPLLAAVFQATSSVMDKFILSIRRMTYREYIGASFPIVFIILLILFLIFRPPLTMNLFTNSMALLLLASTAISIGSNLFYYHALDNDQLNEIQVFELLANIPIILLASVIFVSERNIIVIVLALIASLAVIWSHWEHHHFRILKDTKHFVIWIMVAVPISASISKHLLTIWHPISLEFVRSSFLAVIMSIFFMSRIKKVPKQAWPLLIMTNIFTTVGWIMYYFSFQRFGVVFTALIFSLSPLLVYFASIFVLKEKFYWKKGVAFAVVLISIVIAQVIA